MRREACILAMLIAVLLPNTLAAQTEYGGFLDGALLVDPVDAGNTAFRGRGTTWHLNGPELNMAGAFVRKLRSMTSRFGAELLLQAGKDSELFGFSATAPPLPGSRWLRHVGAANVSYRAPVGSGLTLVGGIFPSLIGYESLYAKDNFTYTRSWAADFTPYLMMGGSGAYAVTPQLDVTAFAINGYWHLANANRVPSVGAQFAYRPTSQITIKETLLTGPHQPRTDAGFWRHLSDTVIEYRTGRMTAVINVDVAAERLDDGNHTIATWLAAQAILNWRPGQRWSVTVRPEVAKDASGRWMLARQTVRALTTGTQYQMARDKWTLMLRAEHRVDVSTGQDGGFFRDPAARSLKRTQHLLVASLIVTFAATATDP